jgi:hypothetical protein
MEVLSLQEFVPGNNSPRTPEWAAVCDERYAKIPQTQWLIPPDHSALSMTQVERSGSRKESKNGTREQQEVWNVADLARPFTTNSKFRKNGVLVLGIPL